MISKLIENYTNEIQIHPKRCLRRRLSSYSCTLCIDNCPPQAINLQEGYIQLDQYQCTDCGRCVAVCPSEAFVSNRSSIYRNIKIKETGEIMFSCYHNQTGTSEEVIIPCLGIISPEIILYLASSHYKTISINTRSCDTCINRIAKESLLKSIDLLFSDFSDYINIEINISNDQTKNDTITSMERRSFLRSIRSEVSGLVSKHKSIKNNHENSSHDTEKRLPAKLSLLNASPLFTDAPLRPQMSLTDECTFCPRCTGMCPTGALKLVRSTGQKTLSFTPLLCSGCGLCEEFCKKKAIRIIKTLNRYT